MLEGNLNWQEDEMCVCVIILMFAKIGVPKMDGL